MCRGRRNTVGWICAGMAGLLAGCLASRRPSADSTPPDGSTPRNGTTSGGTYTDLPRYCAESVRFSKLSSASQKEFRTALDEDGVTRDDVDDFKIRDELPNVDDEIGGETCVRFQGGYYYPNFGPVGGPDEDWHLEYHSAGSVSETSTESAGTDEATKSAEIGQVWKTDADEAFDGLSNLVR